MHITYLIPILVTAVGLFLLVRLRFFFILHPIRTARTFISAVREREARKSLSLALAGTLGVGNIFGVAAGIMIGGEGVVLWLLISSLFSMVIKYSETLLVFDSPSGRFGMAGALPDIFSRIGEYLSPIYATLTLALSLFMGAAMQSSALADVGERAVGVPKNILPIILVLLLIPFIIGRRGKIEKITEIIIPVTTIIYITVAFYIIFLNFDKIPSTLSRIISSAFSGESLLGGGLCGISLVAVKEGFARGILSNEAGAGTSSLGHSQSRGRSPSVAGLFGMCEVFFDTTVLCTLTALVILLTVDNPSAYLTPMSLVSAAFIGTLGDWAGYLLFTLIFAFAYSTIICWYFYGSESLALIFPQVKALYCPIFLLFILLCASLPELFLISATDIILLFMSLITLSAIVKKSGRIKELTDN